MKPTLYTLNQVVDQQIGEKGTTNRDEFDKEIELYLIGEAIKEARRKRNLTQNQLGDLIGVRKAQICRLEKGKNITLSTISKIFSAMGYQTHIEIKGLATVAL
ncbi:MAG: helix-turn-helix domain-containing protein [Paludibacteraceae bacterium]|nr:helix-turn-helix domain-containing protein [Paludibacteraceae bacterium]